MVSLVACEMFDFKVSVVYIKSTTRRRDGGNDVGGKKVSLWEERNPE